MCSSKVPSLALACAFIATGGTLAQPPVHTDPKKPFDFSVPGRAAVGDKVWSAVVLASNVKSGQRAAPVAPELAPYVARLSKFFGYDQFEVLGSTTKVIEGPAEHWLVPTPNFWVGATATRKGGIYRMNMEFFHDKRRLFEAEFMLDTKSPVFIRGPVHVRGQVIMVFEVKP
jgi:hypothetical protein